MPRIIPPALVQEQSRTVTRERYLVRINFEPRLYLSTRDRVVWDGFTWEPCSYPNGYAVTVGQTEWDGSSFQSITIVIGNTDRRFGILCATYNVRGRGVKVWDAAGVNPFPALGDVQQIFDGVIQDAEISEKQVVLRCINQNMDQMYSPREFYSAAWGWSQVMSHRGRVVRFGDEEWRLSAED